MRFGTTRSGAAAAGGAGSSSRHQPSSAQLAIATICPSDDGSAKVSRAAKIASAARGRSGHRFFAMPQTACATTATAATFSPCTTPEAAMPWYCATP